MIIDLENISEKYFSDILSRLLNTKNNNNYFTNEFIKKLFPERKPGGLNNSSIFKEYPVFSNEYTKNIDLLFIDLDTTEEIVIAIENKFLTQDSRGQLDTYSKLIKEQFAFYIPNQNIKLVYLTLDGRKPKYSCENIVCLSWLDDIYELLEKLEDKKNKKAIVTTDMEKDVSQLFKHLNNIKKIFPQPFSSTPIKNQLLEILSTERWKNDKISQFKQKLRPKNKTNDKHIKNEYIIISEFDKGFSLQYFKKNLIDFKIAIPLNIDSRQAMHLMLLFCQKVDSDSILKQDRDKFKIASDLNDLFKNKITMEKKISSYLSSQMYDSYKHITNNYTKNIFKLLQRVIGNEFYESTKGIKVDFENRDNEINDWSKDRTPETDIFGIFEFGVESRTYIPRIVIYLETIKSYCDYKKYDSNQFNIVVVFVILHELVHYYLFPAKIDDKKEILKKANQPMHDNFYKNDCWYKTIEESLCNYIAYSQCWNEVEKDLIKELIQYQPNDYKYALNIGKLELNPLEIGEEWKYCKTFQEKSKYQSHEEFADAIKKNTLTEEMNTLGKYELLKKFCLGLVPDAAKEMFIF